MNGVIFAGAYQGGSLPKDGADLLEYIAPFYATIRHTNLKAIIAHDFIPSSFVEKYSTPQIIFVHHPIPDSYSVYFKRYLALRSLIPSYDYTHWFLCDIKDALITRDPTELFASKEYPLVVGEESKTMEQNEWFAKVFSVEPYLSLFSQIPHSIFPKTCGVWGGRSDVVYQTLDEMVRIYDDQFLNMKTIFGIDMLLFNWVIWNKMWTKTSAFAMQNYYDLPITSTDLKARNNECPRWISNQSEENTGFCKHTYRPNVIVEEFYDRHMKETTSKIPEWEEAVNITRKRWEYRWFHKERGMPMPYWLGE